MSLRAVTDDNLVAELDRLVHVERHDLTVILRHLDEIDRRRLYSTLGYGSLYAYATKRLAYSEDQAHRRISAMRLVRELPEVEKKISSGALNLTKLGLAKTAFRRLDAISEQKAEILSKLENKSTREAEAILAELVPDLLRRDRIKPVGEGAVEFRFYAKQETVAKVEELRGLLAHKHPHLSLGELFEMLCEIGLDALRPAAPREDGRLTRAEIRRRVWQRAGGCCEKCSSMHSLEFDHIVPRGKGGGDEETNLRLLCKSCNQRAAIEEYGLGVMESFLG